VSRASEHFEALQARLALAEKCAERVARLRALPLDELGRPSVFALPLACSALSAAMIAASESAGDIGAELYDVRWNAVVALLHNAGTCVSATMHAGYANAIAQMLAGLRIRTAQLRDRPSTSEVRVRLS